MSIFSQEISKLTDQILYKYKCIYRFNASNTKYTLINMITPYTSKNINKIFITLNNLGKLYQ